MDQLTLRGFDARLEHCIRRLAQEQGLSLNKAALQLMRRGAGIERQAGDPEAIGSGLDDFIGAWTAADADAFDEAVAVFEAIDADQWR